MFRLTSTAVRRGAQPRIVPARERIEHEPGGRAPAMIRFRRALRTRSTAWRAAIAAVATIAVVSTVIPGQSGIASAADLPAECGGGITTQGGAFVYASTNAARFSTLSDALDAIKACGYSDVSGLRSAVYGQLDASLTTVGLLPSAATDINTVSVGAPEGDKTGKDTTLLAGAMATLVYQYSTSKDTNANGTLKNGDRQRMLDLVRAQARASGDWSITPYVDVTNVSGLGTTLFSSDPVTMDAADFTDMADVTKLSAAYDAAMSSGTVRDDLQGIISAEIKTKWKDPLTPDAYSLRIAGQVRSPAYATWAGSRPAGLLALATQNQLQNQMYGLGVLDKVLGTTRQADTQSNLVASALTQVMASGKPLDDEAYRAGFRSMLATVIAAMIAVKGGAAVLSAANDINNAASEAASADALRALGKLSPTDPTPSKDQLESIFRTTGVASPEATKFATFFDEAGKAGVYGLVMNLAQFGATIATITGLQSGAPVSDIDRVNIARGALALASTGETFLALAGNIMQRFDRTTAIAFGFDSDLKTLWGTQGSIGKVLAPSSEGAERLAGAVRSLLNTQGPLDVSIPGLSSSDYSKILAQSDAQLTKQLALTDASVARRMTLSVIKVFGQVAGVAGGLLDIVSAIMTLANKNADAGARAVAGLTLVAGSAGTAGALLTAANGLKFLPFVVGVWAVALTVVAAILTVIIALVLFFTDAARLKAERVAQFAQWTRWESLGIMRDDWRTKFDYMTYSVAIDYRELGFPRGGYGRRDAPKGMSYFQYQAPEYDAFAVKWRANVTAKKKVGSFFEYLDRTLHKGCTVASCAPIVTPAPPVEAPRQALRVMAMGGKVVVGAGVGDGNAFRAGVRDQVLTSAAGSVAVSGFDYVGSQHAGSMSDNDSEGYAGSTIQMVGDRMNCSVGQYRPNVVLMELGTEDMERNVFLPGAVVRYRSLIQTTLMRAPEATVVVGTLPPSTNPTLQARIDAFNSQLRTEINAQTRAGKQVALADMSAMTADDIRADGVTPKVAGYDKMASAFAATIAAVVRQGWIQAPKSGDTSFCGNLDPHDALPAATVGRSNNQQPDPSTIQVGGMFYSVASNPGVDRDPLPGDDHVNRDYARIEVRAATSLEGLDTAPATMIWSDAGRGSIWAPEIQRIDGRYVVYFTAGNGAAHRMYAITSADAASGYGTEVKVDLPDDKWAIDGTSMLFGGQRYFVWSGWAADVDGEQNLYIAKMTSITSSTGGRAIISQPREPWERTVGNPFINEAPEPIKDPNGQLHVVYSTNGSWSDQYCLADLRLKVGGDPIAVWDWYKSNGCLFGSNRANLMIGWDPTAYVNGPGHHTFVLPDGDINQSPSGMTTFPTMYHGVPKGMTYTWANRTQYVGGAAWQGQCTYSRQNSPGDASNTGWSLKFFEDRNYGGGGTCSAVTAGQSSIRNQDPSVIRVGGTYYSVETDGTNIFSRSAGSIAALGNSGTTLIWSSPKNMPAIWAPELVKMPDGRFWVYFASGAGGNGQRMYSTSSTAPDRGFTDPQPLRLPDDKWAVDGTAFTFNGQSYFAWSGWEGDTNIEQNLYIARMNSASEVTGPRFVISQPREGWERTVGNPFINEAPEAIKDPNGQLHIVYSANGSWSDQYCLGEIRLKVGGDPTAVWDWYKSNGCLFGSNQANMMSGWDPTLYVNGPGHNSFVLLDGDINTSPPAGEKFPLEYHGVPKGTEYKWEHRLWYSGSFVWWGNTTYRRSSVPGDNENTGWSLKFFE